MKRCLFLGYILFLICTAFTCDKGEDFYVLADIEGFTLSHVNNGGESQVEIDSNQTVPGKAYVLKINLDILCGENYFEYYYELNDPIQAIQIVTLYPFNEQYPAGSVVTDCFKGFQTGKRHSVLTYWNIDLSDIYIIYNPAICLALMKEAGKGKQQFQVQLILESGKILTHTTSPIVFL